MEEIDRELLDGRPPVLAFLPTAASREGPAVVEHWLALGQAHAKRLGVEAVPVPVLDRFDAARYDLAERLAGAGLIYLSGGDPTHLTDTLRDSVVLQAIVAAWRDGAALAGCSAGAMALSEVAFAFPAGTPRRGWGLVRGLVAIPHFDLMERVAPDLLEGAVASLTAGQLIVGIEEETALIGGPRRWGVRGRGRVWLINAEGRRMAHVPGEEVVLSWAEPVTGPVSPVPNQHGADGRPESRSTA